MEFFAVVVVIAALIGLMVWALTHGRGGSTFRGPGPGAAGAIYDMLNEDKRRAIEIIVEGRAEKTDPETADDLPPDEDGQGPGAGKIPVTTQSSGREY